MAPKKASSRAAARKIKDKWRAKNWYRVIAPDMFEGVQIGETLADDPDKLMGRILDITLQQLTGDFSKMHIKLKFKIDNVQGSDAFSNFIGHTLTSDYIRRLTRRKRSKMDGVYDILTKDSFKLRVKPMAVTEKRIQTSQQYAIRMTMKNVIETHAKDKLVSEFIRSMITGELSSIIFKECKPIYPIKRVEIRCSEVIDVPEKGAKMLMPEIETEETDAEDEKTVESEITTSVESDKAPTPTPTATEPEAETEEVVQVDAKAEPEAKTTEKKTRKTTKKATKKKATKKATSKTTKKTAKKTE